MEGYLHRVADQLLRDKLDAIGAVLIVGSKACGKTSTAEQMAGSILYMDDPSTMKQTDIKRLLVGATPRLIDEWQLAPQLWDAIRFEVDHRRGDGHFILTGSAVPADMSQVNHSGAGRFGWLTMRPMTLWGSGESTGEVSLADLFDNAKQIEGTNGLTIDDLAFVTCRGGWPKAVLRKSRRNALAQVRDYFRAIVQSDISRVDGTNRDAEWARRLLRSYARHQGAQAPLTSIKADLAANEATEISINTIDSYVAALRKIFVLEDMPAWNPRLNSRTAIRTADTRYFVDPSLAAVALGIGPGELINDLKCFGLMFEALCVRDLRVYAEAIDGRVAHYRDSNGLECDAVVHLAGGRYGLIEIKLGGDNLIEEGAKTLKKLASRLDRKAMGEPSFMMVLTGVGQMAYMRTDGVMVVPIGCLKD